MAPGRFQKKQSRASYSVFINHAFRAPLSTDHHAELQATFLFKGFEEVRRLGLQRATEASIRAAERGI